jgi:hypothetical protein
MGEWLNFPQTYQTDLKYTEWLLIMDFFPTHRLGRSCKWEMWQIINAIHLHSGLKADLYPVREGDELRLSAF